MHDISLKELALNPLTLFDRDWLALAAGNTEDGCNAMTVSWGHIGTIWNKPTVVCYVRPQRYTKEFMDREELFTLSRLRPEFRAAHGILGRISGRDGDKIARAGLTPVMIDGAVCFEEADLTLICRKLYRAPLKEEGFFDRSILGEHYPQNDLHDLYIGEILRILSND